jgi:tetratricopeptide (TPR) repeat protein
MGMSSLDISLGPAKDENEPILEYMAQARLAGAAGRLDEALAAYDSVLSIRPGQVEALSRAADIHFEMGRMPAAIAYYSRAFDAQPERHGNVNAAADSLALAYVVTGRRDDAEAVLIRAGLSPTAARVLVERLQVRASAGLESLQERKRQDRLRAGRP